MDREEIGKKAPLLQAALRLLWLRASLQTNNNGQWRQCLPPVLASEVPGSGGSEAVEPRIGREPMLSVEWEAVAGNFIILYSAAIVL